MKYLELENLLFPNIMKNRVNLFSKKISLICIFVLNIVIPVFSFSNFWWNISLNFEGKTGSTDELVFENNKRVFIEVKSVNFLGESIKITNNEYTCAHQLQELYYLALVVNNNDFKVAFIKNPIVSLEFSKQCERWRWVCQNYNENQLDLNSFVNLNL